MIIILKRRECSYIPSFLSLNYVIYRSEMCKNDHMERVMHEHVRNMHGHMARIMHENMHDYMARIMHEHVRKCIC